MTELTKPVVNYTARDFSTIVEQASQFVRATRPDLWSDFYESNLGLSLIELIAFAGDTVSYGQDVTAQEVYAATARRYESMLRWANSIGYVPRMAIASTVLVKSEQLPTPLVLNGGVIEEGATIASASGLKYEVQEQTLIAPGTSIATLLLKEGTKYSETFTPTRALRQEFISAHGSVENASWSVYVGDATDATNKWTQVDNITFEQGATKTYEVRVDGEDKLHIVFGDDTAGKIPDDTITLKYRSTSGKAGDAPIGAVSGSFQVTIPALGSTTVAVPMRNEAAATGGRNRETVDELRRSTKAFIRTLDQVRTLPDYEEAVGKIAGVQLVFADNPMSSYQGNVIRVAVWDTEDVDFTSTSDTNGLTSTVTYERYLQVPTIRIYAVQQYLRPRTLACVHNIVTRPQVAWVDLDLGRVTYNKSLFKASDIHAQIVTNVVKLFENSTGFAIRMSELYEEVLKIPGVRHFTVKSVRFEHLNWDNPITLVTEEFRTDQDLDASEGGPFLPLQDLLIPGASDRKYYDDSYLYDNEIVYDSDINNPNVMAINLRSLAFDLKT